VVLTQTQLPVPQALADRVTSAIEANRADLVALVQDLVRIPSINPVLGGIEPGGEADVQDRVAIELERIGATADRWDALPGRPNLVGTVKGTGGGRSLALNGHIDVVPIGNSGDWTVDPFGGEIRDGRIYGRGAIDMKSGVAELLFVPRILRELGITLKGDLFLESVIDEETGGPGTRETISRGYRPDFAIVLDGATGDMAIMPVEGGLEWLRVTVTGRSGHSALRYRSVHAGGQGEAVNAIEKTMKILAAVNELERAWAVRKIHPLLPPGITTINPGAIAGGTGGGKDGMPNVMTSTSTLADYCSLELSLKYLPTERPDEVRAEFEEYIRRVAATDEWLREHPPTIEWGLRGVSFPPANTPEDHPAIETLAACVEAVGIPRKVTGFVAVSDIAWFGEAGIPAALFGPGNGAGAHGVDEYCEMDTLVTCSKTLALFVMAWCGYETKE
jgi:acetylornithine deacetylase